MIYNQIIYIQIFSKILKIKIILCKYTQYMKIVIFYIFFKNIYLMEIYTNIYTMKLIEISLQKMKFIHYLE